MSLLQVAGIVCWGLFAGRVGAQQLYDPALGTLPSEQGWSYVSLPLAAQLSLTEGAARLDTTSLSQLLAGFSRVAPSPLDRGTGFTLAFSLRVRSEAHGTRVDRAGISVTVLAADRRGIELGFWQDRVWAQSDSPMFVHAEEAVRDTTSGLTDYALTIQGDTYSLTADGTALLSGPVRDYTAFSGAIDPYETPNFLFVGDNTTSASAAFDLGPIALLTVPEDPPDLAVEWVEGGIRLSWPAGTVTWTLEATAELENADLWKAVDQPVIPMGNRNQVDLPVGEANGFFRLK